MHPVVVFYNYLNWINYGPCGYQPPGPFRFGGSMTREELTQKIAAAKDEMQRSGPIHRRDLYKHIRHMEKELRIYDFYHAQAQKKHINA